MNHTLAIPCDFPVRVGLGGSLWSECWEDVMELVVGGGRKGGGRGDEGGRDVATRLMA